MGSGAVRVAVTGDGFVRVTLVWSNKPELVHHYSTDPVVATNPNPGRRKSMCKQCGGGSICDHGRQRQLCKECGGASICTHGRRRSQCKDCGYAPKKCEHGKVLTQCKICRPPKVPKEKGEVI